jgi:hypothetical protein
MITNQLAGQKGTRVILQFTDLNSDNWTAMAIGNNIRASILMGEEPGRGRERETKWEHRTASRVQPAWSRRKRTHRNCYWLSSLLSLNATKFHCHSTPGHRALQPAVGATIIHALTYATSDSYGKFTSSWFLKHYGKVRRHLGCIQRMAPATRLPNI